MFNWKTSQILTFGLAVIITLLVLRTNAATQRNDRGEGAVNKADPCVFLPNPPGEAKGIDKKCPAGGSSSGIAKGDFNGDGFADLAIGEPGATVGGQLNAGDVVVLYGSANGLPQTGANLFYEGRENIPGPAEAGDLFGSALASGDFNGDGFSDLAIGIPGKDLTIFSDTYQDIGRVVVIYGSPNGLTGTDTTVPVPQKFDLSQHFDLDNGSVSAGARLGQALAWGDFDGDGAGDLAIGAPNYTLMKFLTFTPSETGAVWVLRGKKKTSTSLGGLTLLNDALFMEDDLAIGFTNNSDLSSQPNDHFGAALTSGDFNNDTRSDLVIGAPDKQDQGIFLPTQTSGQVYVLNGSPLGLDLTLRFVYVGPDIVCRPGIRLGASLAAGDFNGNGVADLAIGSPNEMTDVPSGCTDPITANQGGSVTVLYGTGTGTGFASDSCSATCQHFFQHNFGGTDVIYDNFGAALAAGDFNGDGKVDLAIGTPSKDAAGFANVGQVYVVYGSSSGISPFATRGAQIFNNLSGLQTGARFGSSLTAWNFGHDETFITLHGLITVRTADLAIGAPYRNVNGVSGAGEVDVVYGSSSLNGLNFRDVSVATSIFTGASVGFPSNVGAHFGQALY
jgi:hypothetical protein